MGNRHPSIAPYEVYPAADRPIVIAVGNDRQFAALCAGLDLPELATDPRFGANGQRVANVDALAELLSARLAQHTAEHWHRLLTPLGVPCGPVNDIADAFDLAGRLGLRPRVTTQDAPSLEFTANPIGLSGTPPRYARRPPRLGEHDAELTEWLDRSR
jgi:crotonobetainyl-CoA:carnitine CoA-transferase CaiB-like acyl-CoA transferase